MVSRKQERNGARTFSPPLSFRAQFLGRRRLFVSHSFVVAILEEEVPARSHP